MSLLVPCDALAGSDQATSPKNVNEMPNSSQYISSQHISKCNMRYILMPESAVSSHREVNPFPDMIESIGLPQVGLSCENIEEAILMDNQTSEEELHNFERVISQFTEKPLPGPMCVTIRGSGGGKNHAPLSGAGDPQVSWFGNELEDSFATYVLRNEVF